MSMLESGYLGSRSGCTDPDLHLARDIELPTVESHHQLLNVDGSIGIAGPVISKRFLVTNLQNDSRKDMTRSVLDVKSLAAKRDVVALEAQQVGA